MLYLFLNDIALQVGFFITLDSHKINHGYFKIFIKPNFSEIGIETRYIYGILKEIATFLLEY